MGDVLSQNEIDNLLAALSTGELDVDEIKDNNEKKVKEYDFARPSKFSKEHLRTMEMIFEHYGRLLSTNRIAQWDGQHKNTTRPLVFFPPDLIRS